MVDPIIKINNVAALDTKIGAPTIGPEGFEYQEITCVTPPLDLGGPYMVALYTRGTMMPVAVLDSLFSCVNTLTIATDHPRQYSDGFTPAVLRISDPNRPSVTVQLKVDIRDGDPSGLSTIPASVVLDGQGQAILDIISSTNVKLDITAFDTLDPGDNITAGSTLTAKLYPSLSFINNLVLAGRAGTVSSLDDDCTRITVPAGVFRHDMRFYMSRNYQELVGIVEPKDFIVAYDISARNAADHLIVSKLDGPVSVYLCAYADDNDVLSRSHSTFQVPVDQASQRLTIAWWNHLYWIIDPIAKAEAKKDYSMSPPGDYVEAMTITDHFSTFGIVSKVTGAHFTAYPNPFTPLSANLDFSRVVFRFDNAGGAETELKVWDITGTLVRALAPGGVSEFYWDGRNESGNVCESGVYIYQVKVGGAVAGKGTVILAR
jgi:hypothetical protein